MDVERRSRKVVRRAIERETAHACVLGLVGHGHDCSAACHRHATESKGVASHHGQRVAVHLEIVPECAFIDEAIDSIKRLAGLDGRVPVEFHVRNEVRVPVVAAESDGRLHRRVTVRAGACDLEAVGRGAAVVDLSVPVEARARVGVRVLANRNERFMRAPRAAVRALLEPTGVRHRAAGVRLVRLRADECARAVLHKLHLPSECQGRVLHRLAARNIDVQFAAAKGVRDRARAYRIDKRKRVSGEVNVKVDRHRHFLGDIHRLARLFAARELARTDVVGKGSRHALVEAVLSVVSQHRHVVTHENAVVEYLERVDVKLLALSRQERSGAVLSEDIEIMVHLERSSRRTVGMQRAIHVSDAVREVDGMASGGDSRIRSAAAVAVTGVEIAAVVADRERAVVVRHVPRAEPVLALVGRQHRDVGDHA